MVVVNDTVVVLPVFYEFLENVFELVLELVVIIDLRPGKWQEGYRECRADNGSRQTTQAKLAPPPNKSSAATAFDAALDSRSPGRRYHHAIAALKTTLETPAPFKVFWSVDSGIPFLDI